MFLMYTKSLRRTFRNDSESTASDIREVYYLPACYSKQAFLNLKILF